MDYLYIRAWGVYHKLDQRHINDELQMARDDKAPQNVIYKRIDATWADITQTGNDRPRIERIAGSLMRRENPLHPIEQKRNII